MLNFLKGPLKVPEISICELFERNAGVNKSQPFMIFRGKFITYFKFSKYINSMAYELKAHGAYQNIVAVAIENPPEFLISVLAAMKAGNSVMIFNEDNLNNEELFYSTVNKMNIKQLLFAVNI
ncbi:AMP-binding protein [Acidiplasma cupricumulans]|uniref:AMP-binding protein n=1 Tax=Acidiplasma cupricumulans TaxID=312540 RepID=UPI000781BE92|nr:AMP-binding protein [Acidiplasma cupricumulans]